MFVDPVSSNYEAFGPNFLSVPNGKAVIFGIPKSGNAWLQSMLVAYFDTDPVLTIKDSDTKGVLSIHDPYDEAMQFRLDFANGVCLIRDIRDVIVSYYHYGQTEEFKRAMTRFYYEDFEAFYYEWFLSRCVPSHQLHTFAQNYAERGIPIVRYERLQADPDRELSILIARWGFTPDMERIKAITQAHHLKILKTKGIDIGYHVEKSHFRKGGWGNFLTEMPSHILRDVNERFEDFLKRWGYPVELSEVEIAKFQNGLI